MAPTPSQTVSTLLPHEGSLGSSTAPFLAGTGAVTFIALAVFGVLGFIAIPVLILKLRSRIFPPLPPTQPLAHYRPRESEYLPQPYKFMGFDQNSHDGNEKASLGPLRMPSFRTIDSCRSRPSTDWSAFGSTIHPIAPPCPSWAEPQSDEHLVSTGEYISTTRLLRSSSLPMSVSRSRHKLSRQYSMGSSRIVSTHTSTRPASIIRGAPHRPHNNIKLVFPAPLSPQLQNRMTKNPSAIQIDGQPPDHSYPTSDRWMQAFIRTWHPPVNEASEDSSPKRFRCSGSAEEALPPTAFDPNLLAWRIPQLPHNPRTITATPTS
jgi:hypothetical protein